MRLVAGFIILAIVVGFSISEDSILEQRGESWEMFDNAFKSYMERAFPQVAKTMLIF